MERDLPHFSRGAVHKICILPLLKWPPGSEASSIHKKAGRLDMTRICAQRSSASMHPLLIVSTNPQAPGACVTLTATLTIASMLLLSCVSKSSDHESNNPAVNSGPAQVS